MRYRCRHNQHAATIAEAGAALGLLLPLAVVIIFVVLEASYAYLIKTSLSQAARDAARSLAISYGQSPSIMFDRGLQNALVFDSIRINNMVNSSTQFDDPNFLTDSNPPVVSVTVRYTSGQNNLPVFPNPDPLNLGQSFVISATSTYRLE